MHDEGLAMKDYQGCNICLELQEEEQWASSHSRHLLTNNKCNFMWNGHALVHTN